MKPLVCLILRTQGKDEFHVKCLANMKSVKWQNIIIYCFHVSTLCGVLSRITKYIFFINQRLHISEMLKAMWIVYVLNYII